MTVRNLVMLRDTTMLECMVTTKTFTMKTAFGSINLRRDQVAYIEYKSPLFGGKDMVQTSDRTTFIGELLPGTISVDFNGQTLTIPKADIKFIVLFIGPVGKVSTKTKKLVAKAIQ